MISYWQKYWAKKKKGILVTRAERYANDADYKAQVIARTRARYQAEHPPKERRKGLIEGKRYHNPRVVFIDSGKVLLHPVGYFADMIGYTSGTILDWENRGILPAPTMVDSAGRRWYSDRYITLVDELLTKHRHGGGSLSEFKVAVNSSIQVAACCGLGLGKEKGGRGGRKD